MAKRTIRRKIRKNKTIRKVMRGCNRGRMKVGGAPIQVHQYAGASSAHANANNKAATGHLLQAQQIAGASTPGPAPPAPPPSRLATSTPAMSGGSFLRHSKRRLRYKKSIARKSRFNKSAKH